MKIFTQKFIATLLVTLVIYATTAVAAIKIVVPASADYNKARMSFNKRINLYPSVIYFCQTTDDVKEAISLAKKLNKKIRIRSGGHNYEGFSNGNNIALIDVSLMKDYKLSKDKKTVIVGAGSTLGELYENLWKNKLTIPGGTCPGVGISGLVLGGGIGRASREMGLTCDSVIEYEMVSANGEILTVNAHNDYRDLFWALCGAGNGNFGVITSIKFKTHPVDKVTIYDIPLNWDEMKVATDTWFEILKHAPRELMLVLDFIKNGKDKTLSSSGQFFGTPQELTTLLEPLLKYANKSKTIIQEVDYMSTIQRWEGKTTEKHRYFKASSIYLSSPLPHAAMEEIDKVLSNPKITDAFVKIVSYGGAIKDVGPNETAFPHRDSLAGIQMQTVWEDNNNAIINEQSIFKLRNALSAYGSGAYINYPDINLKNWQKLYYGNHYAKLQKIKAKYDPTNLFTYEQAIKLPTQLNDSHRREQLRVTH